MTPFAGARIIGATDDRAFVSELLASPNVRNSEFKLSDGYVITLRDLEKIKGAVGAIFCDADKQIQGQPTRKKKSSGTLIGSNHTVITTLHSFVKTNLKTCEFTNFKGHSSDFDFSEHNINQIKSYALGDLIGTDQITVNLQNEIPVEPFLVDDSMVLPGEDFYGVSAYENGINVKGVMIEPIIRRATANPIQYGINPQVQVGFQSDADLALGGSGGVNLFSRPGGLVAKGVFQGISTPEEKQGQKKIEIKDFEAFVPNWNYILSTTIRP